MQTSTFISLALDVVILAVVGGVFFLTTRSLRRGAGRQRFWIRAPLVVLWIAAYVALIRTLAVLLDDAGIGGGLVGAVGGLLVAVGIIAMILQLVSWGRAAALAQSPAATAPVFTPISGDISPLPTFSGATATAPAAAAALPARTRTLPIFFRCAYDGLAFPIRRPVLFVPFVFYMLAYVTALRAVHLELEQIQSGNIAGTVWQYALITLAFVPIFTLAAETTSHMAAEAEVGRPIQPGASLRRAVRRLPRGLAVNILYLFGLMAGVLLLIVPFFVWLIRWILVTQAVMLGNAGVRQAFRVSGGITAGRWWRFALLLLIVGVGRLILRTVLMAVPNAGVLLSGWLDFAWATIALTLAYIRLGGPVD